MSVRETDVYGPNMREITEQGQGVREEDAEVWRSKLKVTQNERGEKRWRY